MATRAPDDRASDDYLLGASDSELQRLEFQHRIWAEHTFSSWRRAGFRHGDRVLDLGCGPGLATLDLAHWVGAEGRVVAVDSSQRYLEVLRTRVAELGLDQIEVVSEDVHRLSLPPESLDAAYARWLFCFSPQPERLVEMLARTLRPGGRLLVTDYFNYRAFALAPRSATFDRVVAAVEEAWAERGGNLAIQGQLPGLLVDHGFTIEEIHQNARVARPGEPLWFWPQTFFREFLPVLVEMEKVDRRVEADFWAEWRERSQDSGSYLCIPPMFDVIAVRRSA